MTILNRTPQRNDAKVARVSGLRLSGLVAGAAVVLLAVTGCASNDSAGGAVGTWGDEDAEHLVLAEDGSLSGSDGCNRLVGSWEQDGDTILFGEVASTMMACEGVDTWLSALSEAELNGDTLTVHDQEAVEIGTLKRA